MPDLVVSLGMSDTAKPYVCAAFVCEKVLREQDDVPSAIRIVDRFTVNEAAPPGMTGGVAFTAFVILKSGAVTGRHPVHLRLNYPNGEQKDLPGTDAEFKGDEHGISYTVQIMVEAKQYGLYWFDVVWEGKEVLTRIPFRLIQGLQETQAN